MTTRYRSALLFTAFLALPAAAGNLDGTAELPELGAVADFRLIDQNGLSHQLTRYEDQKAIVLYGTALDCDALEADLPKIQEYNTAYHDAGIAFAFIDAVDGRDAVAKAAADNGVDMTVLVDDMGLVSASLDMTRTGEAIVIKTGDWSMAYRGAVTGANGEAYLKEALDALVADGPIVTAVTPAAGKAIPSAALPATPDYAKDVAPILAKSCVPCHSDGNIGPFALDGYRQAKGWSSMMREVLMTKRMPPWHADPHYSTFSNDKSLTTDETRTLIAWIDGGSPRSEGDDPLVEAAKSHAATSEWGLGEPDLVVEMPNEEVIPASGVFDYRYQSAPVEIDEDKWVKGIEYVPGNRQVLHHAIIFVQYPDHLAHLQPEWHGGAGGYYAAYVPGKLPMMYPEKSGQFLPKGSTVVFQLHYTATGKEEVDRSKIGLHFCKEKPEFPIDVKSAVDEGFRIAAGDRDSEANAVYRFGEDAMLYSMSPHMHLRGSRFSYKAVYPDGTEEMLLSVPNYDFNWQTEYTLAEPKKMPKGTKIVCDGAFDNSATNPTNPDPSKNVRWGDQSWEEMFIGFLTYAPLSGTDMDLAPKTFEGPVTAETIVGSEWRFARFTLYFDEGGTLLVNNSLNGTWEFTGDNSIHVSVAGRDMDLTVEGSDISMRGRKLVPMSQ